MTQDQEDRFFKKIKVDFRNRISGGIRNLAPVYNEDELEKIESEYKKMFLALVENTIDLEVEGRKFGTLWNGNTTIIESASGRPWSKIVEIYKKCINREG
jgi:hypothetical protein